jgi:hypothetical protein
VIPLASGRWARLRDLVVFRRPTLWVLWPYLPVVRRHPAGEGKQLGVVYDARGHRGLYGYSATVFLTNLWTMPRDPDRFLALPRCVYDTADEMADAGWTVD